MIDFSKKFLIVTDLDHTFLKNWAYGQGDCIPDDNYKTLNALKKDKNFIFALNTGRAVEDGVKEILDDLDLNISVYAVVSNGAHIVKWSASSPLKYKTLQVSHYPNPENILVLLDGIKRNGTPTKKDIVKGNIVKVSFSLEKNFKLSQGYHKFIEFVQKNNISTYSYGDRYMETTGPCCTKAKGLEELIEILGIPKSQTAVIGDGPNDIPMMEAFENSFIVANSDYLDKKPAHTHLLKTPNSEGCMKEVLNILNYPW